MDSRGKCLVIEDDPDLRALLCAILFNEGFEAQAAGTGAEGLAVVGGLNPVLITLDLGLPDLDGHEVAREIRKETMAPLVIITAFATPNDELEAMASGASAYLAKPFRPEDLRELIQRLVPPRAPDTKP